MLLFLLVAATAVVFAIFDVAAVFDVVVVAVGADVAVFINVEHHPNDAELVRE